MVSEHFEFIGFIDNKAFLYYYYYTTNKAFINLFQRLTT